MKTPIIYVLISNDKDFYCEQAIISLVSLHMYNYGVKAILVTDHDTYQTLTGNRKRLIQLVSDIKIVDVPTSFSMLQKSRFIKTSLREIIQGDYLFIDTDTIICSSLEDIDNFKEDIGAVKDHHLTMADLPESDKKLIYQRASVTSWDITPQDTIYFNSGVLFVKDTPKTHELYKLWHKYWLSNIARNLNFDQPALGKANSLTNNLIKELDGIWNCQLATNGIKFLHEAKIIHYYYKPLWYKKDKEIYPYLFYNEAFWKNIKKYDTIPDDIMKQIKEAKSAFSANTYLASGEDITILSSTIFHFIEFLYYKRPTIFQGLNSIFKYIKHITKNK